MQDQDTTEGQLAQALTQLMSETEEGLGTPLTALAGIVPQLNISSSGLYKWTPLLKATPQPGPQAASQMQPSPQGAQDALYPLMSEELSLDIDGRYPLMVASGTVSRFLAARMHWIANLQPGAGLHHWQGTIWYKDGDAASFPYTHVDIRVISSLFPAQRKATVIFSGGGAPDRSRLFKYLSAYHHPVEFEFDCTPDSKPVLAINTHAHPNRPASLPNEALSIQKVFMRAGFDAKISPNASIVPLAGSGADGKWSDMEMHDAMQVYWSRFANKSQWAMWTFFASLHEQGPNLGGIMFDDIGPNHRQGTAIFTSSFISQAPAGDPNPQAWVNRMIFWTACHEMGHAFNLAHSWQKSLGTPWIPLGNEPEARSFMNYPYHVAGGQTAFFSNFEFRFSDAELLFMRHAPARFVQMGNADWFDHHGFEQANVSPEPTLKLDVRVNRKMPEFEFLEPIVLDLKLGNLTQQPQIVHQNLLSMLDHMTVVIKPDGKAARTFHPYAQYCWQAQSDVLKPGQAMYDSLFISAGRNGWDIAEPGYYTIQIALHLEHEDVVSQPLRLRVAPPRSYDEQYIAQDYFSDEVGRILHFDGSAHLTKGLDTLQEASERLAGRRVARHSKIALGNALARDFKCLDLSGASDTLQSARDAGAGLSLRKADIATGHKLLSDALMVNPALAAETLSHIDYHGYADSYSAMLSGQGMQAEAAGAQEVLYQTLAARNVKAQVLVGIKAKAAGYRALEKK